MAESQMDPEYVNNKGIMPLLNILFENPEAAQSFAINIEDPLIHNLSRDPKTRTQIADEFNVSVRTINRWLRKKNLEIPQGLICPGDLRIIYAALGPPNTCREGK